jgi:hypothetical protein
MMVSTYVPVGVPAPTLTVNLELVVPEGLGMKEAVVPAGRPLTVKVTAPANPPVLAMLTV